MQDTEGCGVNSHLELRMCFCLLLSTHMISFIHLLFIASDFKKILYILTKKEKKTNLLDGNLRKGSDKARPVGSVKLCTSLNNIIRGLSE